MNITTDLRSSLLDLLREIEGSEIKLIIGGGFGIYLKLEYIRRLNVRTLLNEWPESRSTNDLDLFLRPELLIQSEKLKPLVDAITRLGYRVVKGGEKYQFAKGGSEGGIVRIIKIDLLTGPRDSFKGTKVKTDIRRVRPVPSVGIHAHPVDEAMTLEKGLLNLILSGNLTSGQFWQSDLFIPHPFTYLMMKLFAFRDRVNDSDKDSGRYHALDLYTILATTTEEEWKYALNLRDKYINQPRMIEAGNIISEYFLTPYSSGMLRLKESPYYSSRLQIEDFMSALKELFPGRAI